MIAALLKNPTLENNSIDGWPSTVDMKVIDPGVVFYEDLINSEGKHVGGNVLVKKEVLDRMAASMEGKPIINWDHRSVKPEEYSKGKFQGIITSVYYNAADGWFHAKGMIWDEATRRNIQNGYSISCAYQVSEWGDAGEYHKVPYEKEVLNGSYTHIAVVPVPRYEGARIELLNSAKGVTMNLLNLFRKDKPGEKIEIDVDSSTVSVGDLGNKTIQELVNNYVKHNPLQHKFDDLDIVTTTDGRKVSIKELKNSMIENAEDDKMEKEHKDGEHKDNAKKNCGMCNSAATHEATNLKEKASDLPKTYNSAERELEKEKERQNAEAESKRKEEEEKKNAINNAAKLDAARNKDRQIPMPEISNVHALAAEGQNRYGSRKSEVTK